MLAVSSDIAQIWSTGYELPKLTPSSKKFCNLTTIKTAPSGSPLMTSLIILSTPFKSAILAERALGNHFVAVRTH